MLNQDEIIVDLFAGGGGASKGIEAATGCDVDIAINHSAIALAAHARNHPRTEHLKADIFDVKPRDAVGDRMVGILWASPDCTHFSAAKGDVPRDANIRSLAWAVVGDPENLEHHPGWCREVRPRVVFMENVREFQTWGPLDSKGRPIKSLAGTEFGRFLNAFRALGYDVDYRMLDAAAYGAPTRRKRLFIIARCDGEPIQWPEITHGAAPLEPEKSAASCIDWGIPCSSIFLSPEQGRAVGVRRPLADKTLKRIAEGVRRYAIEDAEPFIVNLSHGGRLESLRRPLNTITASPKGGDRTLVVPSFISTANGERKGQRPRATDPRDPMRTITAKGSQGGLVTAWLAKHYGGVVGHDMKRPFGTVTARDHHSVVESTLAPTSPEGGETRTPEVRAFLTAYYGSGSVGQSLHKPSRTITARARLGLVTVAGEDYQIVDIGMRMLEPHELLRAQFGRHAEGYDLDVMKTLTKSRRVVPISKGDKVRLIGNSVAPEVAEALVRANLVPQALVAAA